MLSVEQCEKILDIDHVNFESILVVDCQINVLNIPCKKLIIPLSETQKRLLSCLLRKINNKRDLINIVWYENHQCIRDNNYHQLIFQLRALLQRHQLPGDILITIPYYGLKINEPLLRKISSEAACHERHEVTQEKVPLKTEKTSWPSLRKWLLNAIR
ncbi:hypothetical protein ABEH87_10505 [Erwinia sp. Eh17-17]|jgi:DNA-binding winged helix-turn-helix (wHTH) protein|uniref:winged helix-turn-helix domain-containing protein n=1 Tax=Erwinia sp. Eh17-17 TaxID=3080330 RepID=UPI00320A5FEA